MIAPLEALIAKVEVLTDVVQQMHSEYRRTSKKLDDLYDKLSLKKLSEPQLCNVSSIDDVSFERINTIEEAFSLEEKLASDDYEKSLVS